MDAHAFHFIDHTGLAEPPFELKTTPVVITKEAIDEEVDRLASLPRPDNGRRISRIANPATGVGSGLTPGITVSLSVLRPGERTRPIRHNSTVVNFCIRGAGYTVIDGRRIVYQQYDVWNTPPWAVYEHVNDTNVIQVRLAYSNAALLEKLQIHVVDEDPSVAASVPEVEKTTATGASPFGRFQLNDQGACLMPYEQLISPEVVTVDALHWPWRHVKEELDKLAALGTSYVGRRLYLLYHPATGRMNGTTASFFAAITIRPPSVSDRPHRHAAAAINYFFGGRGCSVVEGQKYHWKAGDLMLTAPGWAIHNHASYEEAVYELTVQDSPLNIWMGSLLWQEDLRHPPEVLGVSGGFQTNRMATQGSPNVQS